MTSRKVFLLLVIVCLMGGAAYAAVTGFMSPIPAIAVTAVIGISIPSMLFLGSGHLTVRFVRTVLGPLLVFLGIAFAGLYGSDGFIYGVLWAALSLGAMDSYAQTCPAHFRQIPPVNG